MVQLRYITTCLTLAIAASGCGSQPSANGDFLDVTYTLSRQYTGLTTNELTITPNGDYEESLTFSIYSPNVEISVPQDSPQELTDEQTIVFTYTTPGVYYADLKIYKGNGQPFIFDVLPWEYDTEIPDEPVASFYQQAVKKVRNNLLLSTNRTTNTSAIWVAGDVEIPAGAELDGEGYWIEMAEDAVSVPIILTSGDGLKTINNKYRNVFGNTSALGRPASVLLKTTEPTNCSAEAISTTIANNRFRFKLTGTDQYQLSYSAHGDIGEPIDDEDFTSGDEVTVYLEPTPGEKTLSVSIADIAGNTCLEEIFPITIDPTHQGEGIWVQDHPYWSDSANVIVDINFDHYPSQEPLELFIEGNVSGPMVNGWIPFQENIPLTLTAGTHGLSRILAKFRDTDGNESYTIARQIALNPSASLSTHGDGRPYVDVAPILETTSVTITGCTETYTNVDLLTAYECHPVSTVRVTYRFPDNSTKTITAAP